MRDGLDAATLALYTSGEFELHTRLGVENGSGTRVNLSGRYTKYDLRLPDPSQPIGSLSIDFIRETTAASAVQSLAPTVVASNLNRLDDGFTYSPLLQLGRLVYFDVALTAVGAARPADASTLWYEVFRGYITKVDWPQWDSRRASIECNDQAGILEIAKSEQAYTYVAGTPIETVARQILDNNGFTDVPLYFPAATGKVLPNDYTPGLQKTVWSQLWALAQSMGWVAFYRYRGHNPPELTFFAPAREKTEPDMTVDAYDFRALGISEQEVRNVGYLAFFDAVGAQQLIGPFENAASIAKYGGSKQIRRPFWIKLEEDSPIRSTAEATDMLNAALSDVADPDAIASALLPPMVFAESGVDLYEFVANPRLFDSNQTLAPFSITVSQQAGQDPVSTVDVRGVPTAGAQTWRSLATDGEPTPTDNGVIFKSAQWENYATGPHGQTGLRVKALFDLGRDVKTLRIRYSYYGILANPPGGEPGYYTLDVDVSAEPRSTWVRLYPYDIDGIGDATDPVDITVWPIDSLGNLGTERKFDLDPYDDTGEVGFRVYDGAAMQTSKYVVAGTNITIDRTASNELRINATTDLTGYVPTSRQVIAGAGLTGGGALSGNITINVASHPGTANTVGTLVVEADRVGVALGNTSTTAAPGNHPLGSHPGYLDVTKGGTGLEITAIGRARAVILDPGGSSTALQRLEAPTGAVRYLSASDTGVISWQTISLSGAVPSVGAGWIGRVLQVNGESTYGWGLRLPNVSGPVGQALVSVGVPGGIIEAQWGDVDWQYIANKPATFAPAAHTHSISEVTGLQTALDGKAAVSHTHTISEVTGLQAALDGKANLSGATFTGQIKGQADFSWGYGSSSHPAWLQHSAITDAERGGYGIWLVWNAHKSDSTTWVHDRTTLSSAYRVGVSHHDQGLAFYSGNDGLGTGTVDTWTRVFHVSSNGAGTFAGTLAVNGGQVAIASSSDVPFISFRDANGDSLGTLQIRAAAPSRLRVEVSQPLEFHTNSVARLRIEANGNVGIGYTSDQGYRLAVNGTGYFSGALAANSLTLTGALSPNDGGTGHKLNSLGRALLWWPGGSPSSMSTLLLPNDATRNYIIVQNGSLSYAPLDPTAVIPTPTGAGRVFQATGTVGGSYTWGVKLPNVSGSVGQPLVAQGAPGGVVTIDYGSVDADYITGLEISKITGLQAALDGKASIVSPTFTGDVTMTGMLYLSSEQIYGGFGAETTSGVADWNDVSNARSGNGLTLLRGADTGSSPALNGPGPDRYFHSFSFEYSSKNGSGNLTQFAIPYGPHSNAVTDTIWLRGRSSGEWRPWRAIAMQDWAELNLAAKVHSHDASTVFNTGNVPVAYGGTGRDMSGLTGLVHVASGLFQHIAPNAGGTPQVLQSSNGSWTLGTISGTISAVGSTAGQVLQSTGSSSSSYNWGVKLPTASGPVGQPLVAQGAPGGVVTIDYGSIDAQYITGMLAEAWQRGSNGPTLQTFGGNLNDATGFHAFYANTSATNRPPGGNGNIIGFGLANYTTQLAARNDWFYIRQQEAGVWGAWRLVATEGGDITLGTVYATNMHKTSARWLKKDIEDLPLEDARKVLRLRLRRYRWLDSGALDWGWIADEVDPLFRTPTLDAVYTDMIHAATLRIVQDHETRITAAEQGGQANAERIAALERENAMLRQRLNEMARSN